MSEVADGAEPAAAAPSANQFSAARTAAGMSLADAARHLKLSQSQVEALESGKYERLPGPVFVRGFVRNYARLLKIDPAPLLAEIAGQIQAATPAEPEVPATESIPFPGQQRFNWRPYAIGALAVVAALVAYEFYGVDAAPSQADTHALELPVPKVVAEDAQRTPGAPVDSTTAQPAAAAPAIQTVAREPGPNDKVARLMFTRESWVEVRDGQGRIIFSQLNPAGTAQAVSGLPPLRLVVGNASGVRLLFNDRQVDLAPYTQVDVARLTLE